MKIQNGSVAGGQFVGKKNNKQQYLLSWKGVLLNGPTTSMLQSMVLSLEQLAESLICWAVAYNSV